MAMEVIGDNVARDCLGVRATEALFGVVDMGQLHQGCGLLSELDNFLSAKGFTREMLSMTDKGWGDALYVRNKTVTA